MATKIQLKRNKDTSFDIEQQSSVYLAKGEPFFDSVTNKLYVGDGTHALSDLPAIGGKEAAELVDDINAEGFTKTINGNRINTATLAAVPAAKNLSAAVATDAVRLTTGKLTLSDNNNVLNSAMVGSQLPENSTENPLRVGQIFFKI